MITYPTEENPSNFSYNKKELDEMLRYDEIRGFLYNSIQKELSTQENRHVQLDFDEEDIFWQVHSIKMNYVDIECWVSDCWNNNEPTDPNEQD